VDQRNGNRLLAVDSQLALDFELVGGSDSTASLELHPEHICEHETRGRAVSTDDLERKI